MSIDECTVTFTGDLRRLGRFAASLERIANTFPNQDQREILLGALKACGHNAGRIQLHLPRAHASAISDTLRSVAHRWGLYASVAPTPPDDAQRDDMVPMLVFTRGGFPARVIVAPNGEVLERMFLEEARRFRPEKAVSKDERADGYVRCEDGQFMGMIWGERPVESARTLYQWAKARALQAGFEVKPAPDQPGMFYFVDPHGNGSDISFGSSDEAWDRIVAELSSYEEGDAANALPPSSQHDHPRFKDVEAFFLERFAEDMDGAGTQEEGLRDVARRAAFFACSSDEGVRAVLAELGDRQEDAPRP